MVLQRKPLPIPTGDGDAGSLGEHLLSLGPGKLPVWTREAHWVVEHHTATDTLTRRESGSLHTNLGATGTIVLNLPTAAVKGDCFWFYIMAAQAIQIEPGASGAHYINAAKQVDGKYITSATISDWVLVVADGNADWIVFEGGTWTVET